MALPGAVSESALLGGTPVAEEGEAFLDCLLEVGASEPSFDDVAAVGSEGLSVPAGCGWDFGAMITGCGQGAVVQSRVRGTGEIWWERGADPVVSCRRREVTRAAHSHSTSPKIWGGGGLHVAVEVHTDGQEEHQNRGAG